MKHEWKKNEKQLYLPKEEPNLIKVPKLKFFTIDGKGDPNGEDFSNRVGLLYSLSYAVKMMPKGGYTPDGYFEYTVYPLEGIWDLTEEGRKSAELNKDELIYKIMIRQPEFVTKEIYIKVLQKVGKKANNPLMTDVKFEEIEDGECVQMMHIGPYSEEPKTFAIMKDYIEKNNYKRTDMRHKEIYLSDARKVPKDKLKTVLRYPICKNET